jgi:predicted nucleic acid-binding protein
VARLRGVGGTVVLDAQGIVKLARGDPAARARAREVLRRGGEVVTAASTLAEVLRGGPANAQVYQALKHVQVIPVSADLGRRAGELLGAAGPSGDDSAVPGKAVPGKTVPDKTVPPATADALLATVALAQPRPTLLITSDPAGMARLTREPHREQAGRIAVIPV